MIIKEVFDWGYIEVEKRKEENGESYRAMFAIGNQRYPKAEYAKAADEAMVLGLKMAKDHFLDAAISIGDSIKEHKKSKYTWISLKRGNK